MVGIHTILVRMAKISLELVRDRDQLLRHGSGMLGALLDVHGGSTKCNLSEGWSVWSACGAALTGLTDVQPTRL